MSKLTKERQLIMMELRQQGMTLKDLATYAGVSIPTAMKYVRGIDPVGQEHRKKEREIRASKGLKGNRKLTDEQVGDILARRRGGASLAAIGARFGVTRAAIHLICAGMNYKEIQGGNAIIPAAADEIPRSGKPPITAEQATQVKQLLGQGWQKTRVAKLVGISTTSVHKIIAGKIHPQVEGPPPCPYHGTRFSFRVMTGVVAQLQLGQRQQDIAQEMGVRQNLLSRALRSFERKTGISYKRHTKSTPKQEARTR